MFPGFAVPQVWWSQGPRVRFSKAPIIPNHENIEPLEHQNHKNIGRREHWTMLTLNHVNIDAAPLSLLCARGHLSFKQSCKNALHVVFTVSSLVHCIIVESITLMGTWGHSQLFSVVTVYISLCNVSDVMNKTQRSKLALELGNSEVNFEVNWCYIGKSQKKNKCRGMNITTLGGELPLTDLA